MTTACDALTLMKEADTSNKIPKPTPKHLLDWAVTWEL